MPAFALPSAPSRLFRWDPTPPRIGRRAVSYYARWPSRTQGRAILLQSKELLPIASLLESCAILQLIQAFHEQPGVLTRPAAIRSTAYQPDFLFSRNGISYLVFASQRSLAQAADLAPHLLAVCETSQTSPTTLCHFRVCRFSPTKATISALSALSPARLQRGLPSHTEQRLVTHLFREWIGGH
ncbi:hypothetical protein SAMN04488595_12918 [Ralstonia sp. 25mfcol4.1]|uniref:hypothetical protein n=1 Tax=Ralstonia sp. 25mfcol4.1 TaxID=1761899 RepID=UPI000881D525|nr:hypothetical protein [Ralstonia sp. 25mfcol4.1]SDP81916.1 hypothetical protein SAMN04488595_12918 [Ralstonia sp. 25mfcol4.1]